MRRWLLLWLGGLLALLVGCSEQAGRPARVADTDPHARHAGLPEGRVPVSVDPAWVDRLAMRVEPARVEPVATHARAVASVVPEEGSVVHIHARVAGWVERMHVGYTGERLARAAPVASIWSPELYAAQSEYLLVLAQRDGSPASAIVESSRQRLKVLGMSEAQIAMIERRGEPMRTVTITTPRGGVVLRRPVPAGTSVDPSTELLTLADLSRVWVVADIAESDAALAEAGSNALVRFPGREDLEVGIDFVSATVEPRSRTLRVRATVDNTDGRLRPGMSGTLQLSGSRVERLTVPRDAVVDDGQRALVYVQGPDGSLIPREVRIGGRRGERVVVLDGLEEGEPVLVSGVFLVDSESRLLGGGGAGLHSHGSHGESSPSPGGQDDPHRGHR